MRINNDQAKILLGVEYTESNAKKLRALLRKSWKKIILEYKEKFYIVGDFSFILEYYFGQICAITKQYSVECIRYKYAGIHHHSKDIWYLNAGDTYASTLIYYQGKRYIGTWGDIIEKHSQDYD